MIDLDPNKLFVQFNRLTPTHGGAAPRRYSAAHLSRQNRVHLTIGPSYEQSITTIWSQEQPSDELYAEWRSGDDGAALHVFCGSHIESGGQHGCRGEADAIRRFVQAVRYADRHLFSAYPALDQAPVFVHCGDDSRMEQIRGWGIVSDFRLPELQGSSFWTQFEMPRWQSLSAGYDPI